MAVLPERYMLTTQFKKKAQKYISTESPFYTQYVQIQVYKNK